MNKETINNKLKELGFELKDYDKQIRSLVYENVEDDQRVIISDTDDEWYIYSESISTDKDWYGDRVHSPMGISSTEIAVFMELINILKTGTTN